MSSHLYQFAIQLIHLTVERPIQLIMLEAVIFLGAKTIFLKPIPPGRQPHDVLRIGIHRHLAPHGLNLAERP